MGLLKKVGRRALYRQGIRDVDAGKPPAYYDLDYLRGYSNSSIDAWYRHIIQQHIWKNAVLVAEIAKLKNAICGFL